jgi:hypothetical protein
MYKDAILDELRRVERDVVEGERQLADQEALMVALKRQNKDTSKASAEPHMIREAQQRREVERQRLLARSPATSSPASAD